MFVRDDDIPTFVGDGVCELGIVGGPDDGEVGHRFLGLGRDVQPG